MKLSSKGTDLIISLQPYPYESAAAISFDYESSAQSYKPSISAKARSLYRRISRNGKFLDLSSGYGRGYGNRAGAELIKDIFENKGLHGTWFSTGHALLKGNRTRKEYRINQKLNYAAEEKGFGFIGWRKNLESFYHEPFGDYRSHRYYYLGDLTRRLLESGEDIQSHSFSHPYVPLEPGENLNTDLEDWQSVSEKEIGKTGRIFAFPYLGDYYGKSKKTGDVKLPSAFNGDEEYEIVNLNNEQIEIFKKNGFELFTRCMSKNDEEPSEGFRDYNNSGISYISCKGIYAFGNSVETFDEYLNYIIENNRIIDYWLHPNDILDETRYDFFLSATELLKKASDEGKLWVVTLKEMWDRKKLLDKLVHSEERDGLILKNSSNEQMNDVILKSEKSFIVEGGKEAEHRRKEYRSTFTLRPGEKAVIKQSKES